jgi:hypothetical protein
MAVEPLLLIIIIIIIINYANIIITVSRILLGR